MSDGIKCAMTQSERFMVLINSTPGVVSDEILKAHGIRIASWRTKARRAFPVVRVGGLGYRKESS